jgi:hypothetical protein
MSEPTSGPQLLVVIVKDHHQVEELLMGFLDLGIRGATVIEGRGMGQILSSEVPIFAGFRSLFPGGSAGTYLVLSVVEGGQLEDGLRMAREVCGDFDRPGAGVLFTLPLGHVEGLARAF